MRVWWVEVWKVQHRCVGCCVGVGDGAEGSTDVRVMLWKCYGCVGGVVDGAAWVYNVLQRCVCVCDCCEGVESEA